MTRLTDEQILEEEKVRLPADRIAYNAVLAARADGKATSDTTFEEERPLTGADLLRKYGHLPKDSSEPSLATAPELNEDAADLLDQVNELLSRFVAFPSCHACYACCAWVLHTWVLDAFDSTPRLAALSPEKSSGKTRLLEVLDLVVPNPKHTVNMSAAVLFRLVGGDEPVTLLMDEADTYLGWRVAREHEDIRGLVNAGHRRGATAYRMKMEGGAQVQEFPAFAPIALAGIGDLPDTVLDRSIVIAMKRRTSSETIEPFRRRLAAKEAEALVESLSKWAGCSVKELPGVIDGLKMPSGIEDRPADVWEALIAIGDLAGNVWSKRIREAAVALNSERLERDPSLGVQLLNDIRSLFDLEGAEDRVTSHDLVSLLTQIEGAPWSNIKGEPIDAHGVARRLRPYGIRPDVHRFGDRTARGYLRQDFWDAWERYSPPPDTRNNRDSHDAPSPRVTGVTGVTASTGEGVGHTDPVGKGAA